MKDHTNILFIMCDQLRWDYLSCCGHPHLETPNIDRLAACGVRFARACCLAPLCGPSRASIHTGRYMSSHGAMANEDPLKPGELTLGDYMRDLGLSPMKPRIGRGTQRRVHVPAGPNRTPLRGLQIAP